MRQASVSESRDIKESAAQIFSILSNPAMHPSLDGSGMLRAADDEKPISAVGDVFLIHMTHWDRGNYSMANHVVAFEHDRLIAWEPIVQSYERPEYQSSVGYPALRQWGWMLEPLSDESTRVTVFFEGSQLPAELRKFIKDGEFWRPAMQTSLDNLERILARGRDNSAEEFRATTAAPFVELYRQD